MTDPLIFPLLATAAYVGQVSNPVVTPSPGGVIADLTNVAWNNWYSPNMPAQVVWGGSGFPLPNTNGLHYVTYPFNPSAVGSIHFKMELTGDPNNVVHFDSADIQPCKLTLFFGTTDLTFAHLRFWSDAHANMANMMELNVPMDPAVWHTVDGSHDPGAFAAMKNSNCFVGWTCGGQFFDGHGIYSTGGNGLILHSYQLLG